jgi:hypothetical protein
MCSSGCYMCFIWMLYMLQWLYTYVASICFKCFIYFRRMLQRPIRLTEKTWLKVLFIDLLLEKNTVLWLISPSEQGESFIWMLHMFQWLYTYVASIYSKYFICFRSMMQVFFLYVAYMLQLLYTYIANVCCKCFSCFRPMWQKCFMLQQ